jgi:hypothetical protein
MKNALPILFILSLTIAVTLSSLTGEPVSAQTDEITWSYPINVSQSPDMTSADPFLLADPASKVHLFWAEKVMTFAGNVPDTIMYSSWDGLTWSKPVDIFFSPASDGNPKVSHPNAILDDRGWIHLIWLSQPNFPNYSLNYSSVPSWLASSPQAWQPKTVLADNLSGTEYSVHMAYNPSQGIHVAYAKGALSDNITSGRSVASIYSLDYGDTWSEPVDLVTFPDLNFGASCVRVLLVNPNNVFVSWTVWDLSGNGQAILLARSLDNGGTWDKPISIAERSGDEYERDWNNMVSLGKNTLASFYEGGWRAYHYARYSYDNGVTWSEPIDTFPWLIGENGFAEFAQDSNGTLHLFIAKRIREGNDERGDLIGLWHSVWEGGTNWREPALAGGEYSMVNPKAVIVGGNRVVSAFYDHQVLEMMVMTGVIENAPPLEPVRWPDNTVEPTSVPASQRSTQEPTPTPKPAASYQSSQSPPSDFLSNPGVGVLLGAIPALVFMAIVFYIQRQRLSQRS